MNRATWKWWYRKMRICRRETSKAAVDMLVYGSGFVQMGPDIPDFVRHVPFDEWVADQQPEPANPQKS